MSKSSYSRGKVVKIIGRKSIISNSNKTKPLLNASEAWQTFPDGSLKKRKPPKQFSKKKKSLVTEVDKQKTSFTMKQRKWHNFTVKFQNLKHKLLLPVSTIRKLIWKVNNLKLNIL